MQSEWSSDKQEKYTQKIQFYEENNILKVQSRLILGQDPEDFLRPTILRDHPIVRRLIDYAHKTLHPADNLCCQLRQRFQKEYLAELIRNPKLPSKRHNLSTGDVVLIGSDNTKRLNWPLGRFIELFQGKDNIERVAKLRVANGEIIRPIQRIYPLGMSSTEISKSVPENIESIADITELLTVCTLFRTSILHKLIHIRKYNRRL
ncbi:hypothetical protein AVEN_250023-1 [Araneus ventricosus]|uniref:DUF5641 domain-containing protein n=1 Tax=Araneus ventricosus TaxID=182803 RepID=A0A4Y2QCG3_ARAVE|nr:hypothetical protein AVEN_257591-1 [Araneus ventricosus]GBN61082.1 hypothetical protein AVEN_250023-1 [Araneus ventricosus]